MSLQEGVPPFFNLLILTPKIWSAAFEEQIGTERQLRCRTVHRSVLMYLNVQRSGLRPAVLYHFTILILQ